MSHPWASRRGPDFAGDRARGIVKKHFRIEIGEFTQNGDDVGQRRIKEELDSYDDPYYFSKSGAGWLIDLPTEEEQKKDEESDMRCDLPCQQVLRERAAGPSCGMFWECGRSA